MFSLCNETSMAAEVSSLARYLNGHRTAANASPVPEKHSIPITRDLLGGGPSKIEAEELDLDLHVPTGWEKRLDLKSGKVYIERCSSTTSTLSISGQRHQTKLQDLNTPPYSPSKLPRNRSDDPCLDLKLVSSSPSSSSCNYQSVCTLDKVKSALERAEKETTNPKRRSPSFWNLTQMQSPSCSSSSSSTRETEAENRFSMSPVALGCPICLAYVLVSEGNPKCPRCNVTIPVPKKPKIDLNMSF